MLKLITKMTIFSAMLLMFGVAAGNSIFGMLILGGILLLFVVLLVMILVVLIKEFKLFQNFNIFGQKNPTADPLYLTINYNNIKVSYLWSLNGGGVILAYEFVRVVTEKIGKVGHVFEYCAGPGFIGFSLLANNLCDKLTFADVNPDALAAIHKTIKDNALEDKVTIYQADCLDDIPIKEQWDLVVGNPPWYICPKEKSRNIRLCDPEGKVHQNFYHNIAKHLKPQGTVIFIEGGEYTNTGTFQEMMQEGGMEVVESFGTVSFGQIFKDAQSYKGLSRMGVIFLRLGLFVREAYFIWSQRKQGERIRTA